MAWFPLHDLPAPLIDYPAAGIRAYRNAVPFSVHGWQHPRVTATV